MKDLKFIGIGGAYALGLGGNCAYLNFENFDLCNLAIKDGFNVAKIKKE